MRGAVLDPDEITTVYRASGGELWRAMLVVSGGRLDLAKEAMAEAFARLVANAEQVNEPRAWLYRTAYRIVLDELRREARLDRHMPELHARTETFDVFSPSLTAALRMLPPKQRLPVFLVYGVGMPLSEVAALTGSPIATVKVRLHRARKALRRMLAEEDADA